MNSILTLLAAFFVFSGAARAETATPPTPSKKCHSAEHRQWDFWIGNWVSYDKAGSIQGYTLVQSIENGCALQEWWHGTDGLTGTSFSIYDRTRKVWNQTWVSGGGTLLPIEGRLVDKRIVLWGNHVTDQGVVELHRTIWTPQADGTVTQVWDKTPDGGQTWEIVYEGFLHRTDKPFQ